MTQRENRPYMSLTVKNILVERLSSRISDSVFDRLAAKIKVKIETSVMTNHIYSEIRYRAGNK